MREPGRALELVFSHLHMDHLFAFPFFVPLYTPSFEVGVTLPAYSDEDARERIGRYLDGVYHPVRLGDLPGQLRFSGVRPGEPFERGGYRLTACSLNHPGGSFGYRVDVDGQSLAYVTDTSPFARPGQGVLAGEGPTTAERRVIEWMSGVDLVIYDTMYTFDEYLERMTYGHSYPEYGVAIAQAAGARQIVLFHHKPEATDDELDALEVEWAAHEGIRVRMAAEGREFELLDPVRETGE